MQYLLFWFIMWFCVLGFVKNSRQNQSPRVVFTKQGPVQGIVGPLPVSHSSFPYAGHYGNAGASRPMVEIFKGIPYATPPLNGLRYESPAPLVSRSRSEVYHANLSKPGCPRTSEEAFNRTGNIRSTFLALKKTMNLDDCLYLDIYAPLNSDKVRFNQGLPVLVFSNSDLIEDFDGSSVASIGNIIVVSFRYRIGVLGFLQTGFKPLDQSESQGSIIGNYGLWDQLAALQWIKENIEAFGGNSNKITLMGYDFDANLIGLLATSPVSQAYGGLFHRLIMLNGSPFTPMSINQRPLETTFHLARTLNCPLYEKSEGDLVNCFRRTPVPQLLKAAENIGSQLLTYPYAPFFDETLLRSNKKLNSPLLSSSISHENLGKYDVLMGLKEGDTLPIIGRPALKSISIDRFLNSIIKLGLNSHQEPNTELKETVLKHIIAEYGTSPPIRELLSDYLLVSPMVEFLNAHRKHSEGKSTFFYVFKDYDPLKIGRKHNELAYIFSNELYKWKYQRSDTMLPYQTAPLLQADLSPFELLVNLLANFVRSGDPNLFDLNDRTPPTAKPWPHYTNEFGRYLELGREIDFPAQYANVPSHFWSETFPAILRPYLNNSEPGSFPPIFPSGPSGGRNYRKKTSNYAIPDINDDYNLDNSSNIASVLFPIGQSSVLIIGLTLLVLNTLCFLGLFYQRMKLKKVELRLRKRYLGQVVTTSTDDNGHEEASFYGPNSEQNSNQFVKKSPSSGGKNVRIAPEASSDGETDNGFGPDFLSPNYDPRTKVNRWMRNSREISEINNHEPINHRLSQNIHPSILISRKLVQPQTRECGPSPESFVNFNHEIPAGYFRFSGHNQLYPLPPGHLDQPFKPTQNQREMDEMSMSIPFADSIRTISPSVANNYSPIVFNNTNNTNNKASTMNPAASSRGSTLIVRDLEEPDPGENEPKMVPVKTGTLTRSVAVQ